MNKEKIIKYSMIGLILLAVIVALTVILWPKAPDNSAGMGLTVDPYSGAFVQPEKAEEDTESTSGIAIPGWGSIHIQAGEKLVDVNLENPIDNEGKYYLSFSVYLNDQDKPLAETGLIQPGESALKLSLSHPLDAGEYEAVVLVQPYRMADGSATNNAEIETILIVE